MPVRLIKYQALGNDYLVLDQPGPLDQLVKLLPILCHPHFGLGSDGLLAFDPAALSVRIFNPDGSEAQKSGNGLRIAAAHAVLEAAIATGRTRLWSTVRTWNSPSFRVLDKLGFQRAKVSADDRGELVWLTRALP